MPRCCAAWPTAATGWAPVLTLKAVVSVTLVDIGTQSPTWVCWMGRFVGAGMGGVVEQVIAVEAGRPVPSHDPGLPRGGGRGGGKGRVGTVRLPPPSAGANAGTAAPPRTTATPLAPGRRFEQPRGPSRPTVQVRASPPAIACTSPGPGTTQPTPSCQSLLPAHHLHDRQLGAVRTAAIGPGPTGQPALPGQHAQP